MLWAQSKMSKPPNHNPKPNNTPKIVLSKIIKKSTFLSARPKEWEPHMIPSSLIYLGWCKLKLIHISSYGLNIDVLNKPLSIQPLPTMI